MSISKKRKIYFSISFVFILILVYLLFVFIPVRLVFVSTISSNIQLPESKQLSWENELNKKQSHNSCASYSTMAYIFEKNQEIVNPETINKNITGKLRNNSTYPWGIVNYLKKQNINTKIYYHGFLSNKSKIQRIEERINHWLPVILLIWVWKKDYLHYITVVWYQKDSFQIYNSLNSTDKNGNLAGNETIQKNELLKKWESAKYKKIQLDLAISE